jgi:hypothetical protein
MKKTVKSNPLKTFNDNKALAVKKMGGAQASFKKKLPKAQYGYENGPNWQGPMQERHQKDYDKKDKLFHDAQKANIIYGPKGTFDSAYDTDMRELESAERQYRGTESKVKKTGGAKMKTGGATKATKFAALAPPYNKATAADRIAGAKKNKKK